MGMHPYFYVGPFLRCTTSEQITTYTEYKCDDHPYEKNGNFCKQCGKPLKEVKKKVKEPVVDEWSAIEAIDGALWDIRGECREKLVHYFAPNVKRGGEPDRHMTFHGGGGYGDEGAVVEGIDSEAENKWFAKAFKDEIKILKGMYDNVEICWGIVGGYS